jgi:hypothetical protein
VLCCALHYDITHRRDHLLLRLCFSGGAVVAHGGYKHGYDVLQ